MNVTVNEGTIHVEVTGENAIAVEINHSDIDVVVTPSAGVTNHAELENLDYDNSGHTGFAAKSDLALEPGAGSGSAQTKAVTGIGQITLTNGSDQLVGTGTELLGDGGILTLDYWYQFMVDGVVYEIDSIENETHATLASTWELPTATTDLIFDVSGTATGNFSVATGVGAIASGESSAAIGGGDASGKQAVVLGNGTASNLQSVAMNGGTATGENSLAAISGTAHGNGSVALGGVTNANNSVSILGQTDAIQSVAINAIASEYGAIAIGLYSEAVGSRSLAMNGGKATGALSTAVGSASRTENEGGLAMGFQAVAEHDYATALGYSSLASGYQSLAIGSVTKARSRAEVAIGAYNTDYTPLGVDTYENADRAFIVGIGRDLGSEKDGLIIYKNGRVSFPNADTLIIAQERTIASATATGTPGEVCFDNNYIYRCVATDTWKRVALSTW